MNGQSRVCCASQVERTILRALPGMIKRSASRRRRPHVMLTSDPRHDPAINISSSSASPQVLHEPSTAFPHGAAGGRQERPCVPLSRRPRGAESTMMACRPMRARLQLLVALVIWACAVSAEAATDATLFRLFLKDGSALVSYGEYTRVDDRVVFSMPVGGSAGRPAPAGGLDFRRLGGLAAHRPLRRVGPLSALRRHAGEEDFAILNNEVARVLNDIALSTDRAERPGAGASRPGPRWPSGRSSTTATGRTTSAKSSRSSTRRSPDCAPPAAPPPSTWRWSRRRRRCRSSRCSACRRLREQLDQVLRLAAMAPNATERVALLQSALAMVQRKRCRPGVAPSSTAMRASLETRIRTDLAIDRRYAQAGAAAHEARRARGGAGAHHRRREGAEPARARGRQARAPASRAGRVAARLASRPA